MKNTIDDADDSDWSGPSPKRIKLEQDVDEASHLLSGSISTPLSNLKRRGRLGRSSSDERAKALLEDTRISAVEPQQVLCRMCGHWIRLFKHIDYGPANWHTHAEKCEVRTRWKDRVKRQPDCVFTLTIPPLKRIRSPSPSSAPPRISIRLSDKRPVSQVNEKPSRTTPPSSAPVTDTISNGRARGKTTDERRQALEADKRAISREPHRVQCGSCKMWVKLHNTREYDLWNWTRHIEKCKSKPSQPPLSNGNVADKSPADSPGPVTPVETLASAPDIVTSSAASEADVEAAVGEAELRDSVDNLARATDIEEQEASQDSTCTRVKSEADDELELLYPAQESATPERPSSFTKLLGKRKNRKGRSLAERKQTLEEDERCGEVRPHEVFCLGCKRWIQLYQNVAYIDSNWTRHAERCFTRREVSLDKPGPSSSKNSVPTPLSALQASVNKISAVDATKGRLQTLHNDKRIKEVEPRRVLCGLCDEWIKLRVHREYDTYNWSTHVATCAQRQPTKKYSSNHYPNANYTGADVKTEDSGAGPLMSMNTPPVEEESVSAPVRLKSAKAKDESSPESRRDILLADDRCKEVEPHRVMCKVCLRHVGLHSKKLYSLANWYKHIDSCSRKAERRTDNTSMLKPPLKTPLTTIGYLRNPARESNMTTLPVTERKHTRSADASDVKKELEISMKEPEVSMTGLQSKNSEDRRMRMLDDSRIEELEPHRVLCKLCHGWFKLHKQIEYASFNWEKHIEICEKRSKLQGEGTTASPIIIKEEQGEQTPQATLDPLASYNAKLSNRKRTTPQERFAFMSADSRIKIIEKHRAQCGICDKWIKLQSKIEYEPHNWQAHVKKCEIRTAKRTVQSEEISSPIVDLTQADAAPSDVDNGSSLTIEERRALLEKDDKCSVVEPHRVMCGMCQQWIKLRDEREYVCFNWYKHKGRCEKRHNSIQSSENQVNGPEESASVMQGARLATVVKEEPVSAPLVSVNRAKKSDEQREADLRADPRQDGVEPGRVFCRMCRTWIRLNTATGYLPSNWLRHAQRCQRKTGWKSSQILLPAASLPRQQPVEVVDLDQESAESGVFGFIELGSLISAFEPTVSSTNYGKPWKGPVVGPSRKSTPTLYSLPTLRARPTTPIVTPHPPVDTTPKESNSNKRLHRPEQIRKEDLEKDTRTKVVLADRILCRMCDKWIQMRRDVSYSPQNWLKHANICEVRTGWVQRTKVDAPAKVETEEPQRDILSDSRLINSVMGPVVEVKDEFNQNADELPYNARVHKGENQIPGVRTPHFKPVAWSKDVLYSDEEPFDSDASEVEEQRFGEPRPIVHQVLKRGDSSSERAFLGGSGGEEMAVESMGGIESTSEGPSTRQGSEDKEEMTQMPNPPLSALTRDNEDTDTGPKFVKDSEALDETSSLPSDHRGRPISKPSHRAHPPPFTRRPLMRQGIIHHPFGHRPLMAVRPQLIHFQPSHMSTPNKNLSRSGNGVSETAVMMPAPIPYLNILPHLLPKTMVYSYNKGPLPSPFLTPATPPTFSPYANPSPALSNTFQTTSLPTPPATANSSPSSPAIGAQPAPDSVVSLDVSQVTSVPEVGVSTSMVVPSAGAQTPVTNQTKSYNGGAEGHTAPSSSAYGPVKPGILQLAPVSPAKEDSET